MNIRNLRKAKRVGAFLKIATRMLKNDKWNNGYRSYVVCVGQISKPFHRRELVNAIDKNRKLLKKLLQ